MNRFAIPILYSHDLCRSIHTLFIMLHAYSHNQDLYSMFVKWSYQAITYSYFIVLLFLDSFCAYSDVRSSKFLYINFRIIIILVSLFIGYEFTKIITPFLKISFQLAMKIPYISMQRLILRLKSLWEYRYFDTFALVLWIYNSSKIFFYVISSFDCALVFLNS